jgi:hypothetical protein
MRLLQKRLTVDHSLAAPPQQTSQSSQLRPSPIGPKRLFMKYAVPHGLWAESGQVGIPDDRDRSFRRIVTEDSDLS